MKIKSIVIITLMCLFAFPDFGQNIENNRKKILWQGVRKIETPDNNIVNVLSFESAKYFEDNGYLPVFSFRHKIAGNNFKIKIVNKIFDEFDDNIINKIGNLDLINDSIIIKTIKVYEKKEVFALVSFVPIRKNPITEKYEKLVSFEISVDNKTADSLSPKNDYKGRIYKSNSVLSEGNWYKIRVNNSGIYKISFNDLSDMGINVSDINPKKIKIYGNGPGMLSEDNSGFRYDDLIENSIFVKGEDDGKFDNDDYILFYGQSSVKYYYNKLTQRFEHKVNIYSDYTYYFLTISNSDGKRISPAPLSSEPATEHITKFNDFAFHELESENFIKSGRLWFGERFDAVTNYNFTYNFPNIDNSSKVFFKARVAAKSEINSSFSFDVNSNVMNISVPAAPAGYGKIYAYTGENIQSFYPSNSTINVAVNYNKTAQSSVGWLDYMEINVVRNLMFTNGQMLFRNVNSVGENNISEFIVANSNSSVKIWDVTYPDNVMSINANLNSGNSSFKVETDTLKEFIAFDNTSFYTVEFVEKIQNQNLHSLSDIDMIIVTHPDFIEQANNLANIHKERDNLNVVVVTTTEVYNEFSSGAQDISAIRDFVKMLFDKAEAGDEPKYLLLFGDSSYDFKDRIENNTNFIPSYQSAESFEPNKTYLTDDFYGFLDEPVLDIVHGIMDIAIGRLPVKTPEEADDMVRKISYYLENKNLINNNDSQDQISNLGDWRNTICFVADDKDKPGDNFITESEDLAIKMSQEHKEINIDKIYSDAYQQITTPAGQRYPDVNNAINKQLENGALVINYIGHGGEVGWSLERILEISDINQWKNKYNMPIFFTATCEFSKYDDPDLTSAGELAFLNPNGGGIALFTTARPTYGGQNRPLNRSFFNYLFKKENNIHYRLGEVYRLAKNDNTMINTRKYVLFGDPALEIAFPKHNIVTNEISKSVKNDNDTIRAFAKITINGEVQDDDGSVINTFNGIVYPTVFDKPETITSYGHDNGSPTDFDIQKSIIYKGKASVENGLFSFSFIVPKDISYKFGNGKISYYAQDGITDANGYDDDIIIGGFCENFEEDNIGPDIRLFMNDVNFKSGDITDENPILIAYVSDSSGINTVGTGIGHDIIAVLDNNTDKSEILNDYYQADIDSYKKGVIRFPYMNLSEGLHTINLKVWDIFNNSSQANIEFYVKNSDELCVNNLMNYPNPFRDNTSFVFNHNYPGNELDVQIRIFSVTGQLVKSIHKNIISEGYRTEPIFWNGKNDAGKKLSRGIYIYKLIVHNVDGSLATDTKKLIVLH